MHPAAPTGRAFAYSNLGYNIFSLVIDARFKEGWKEVLQREVFLAAGHEEHNGVDDQDGSKPARDRGIGIVVLVNGGGVSSPFTDLVATYIYDRMRDEPGLETRYEERLTNLRQQMAAAIKKDVATRQARPQAQALRCWDTQRQATAPLDTGEDIQIACGVVATIALLGWVARAVPEIWTVPSFALVTVVSSAVVAAAAALTVWDMKRTSQG